MKSLYLFIICMSLGACASSPGAINPTTYLAHELKSPTVHHSLCHNNRCARAGEQCRFQPKHNAPTPDQIKHQCDLNTVCVTDSKAEVYGVCESRLNFEWQAYDFMLLGKYK